MSKKLTKEEFIKKAREKHGDKYDYSNVDYKYNKTKVCIICPEHGEFWQAPHHHTKGQGCPKCKGEATSKRCRLSLSDFIKKSREKHGNKYNYDKVKYENNSTKVCIICHEHGIFYQTPHGHLKGQGCPKCGQIVRNDSNRLSLSNFIKKANEKHNGKYDYSKVIYVNNYTKICIICPKHGEFLQTPSNHLSGQGCPKCKDDKTRERLILSKEGFIKKAREVYKEDFVKKANKIHHDKYNYSKVEYDGALTKVCVICPEHGEFWQTPNSHLNGTGCPKCSGNYIPTTEEWITSANEKHNGKYDYHKVKYVKSTIKVCIICPEHGEFLQKPTYHIQGQGCPKCNLSHMEHDVMNYLDERGIPYDYQKRFDWLGRQSLDFYLPDYNVGVECQGEQHFFPVKYFGGEKTFKKTLERDKRKKKLCEENGVKLLYFGNVPNYDTFLGEAVHDDVQYLIDYLEEHKKENK